MQRNNFIANETMETINQIYKENYLNGGNGTHRRMPTARQGGGNENCSIDNDQIVKVMKPLIDKLSLAKLLEFQNRYVNSPLYERTAISSTKQEQLNKLRNLYLLLYINENIKKEEEKEIVNNANKFLLFQGHINNLNIAYSSTLFCGLSIPKDVKDIIVRDVIELSSPKI